MVVSQNVGVQYKLDFGIKSKLKSALFTMIPKIYFTQNVTCSLFCGNASQILSNDNKGEVNTIIFCTDASCVIEKY